MSDPCSDHAIQVLGEKIVRERELREAFEKLMEERGKRYDERFNAQKIASDAALSAQEKLTSNAFNASDRAINKAEAAQNAHNILANGLQGRLDQQAKDLISRPEFDQRFISMEDKVNNLREYRSSAEGRTTGISSAWGVMIAVVGIIGGGGIVGLVLLLMKK